MSLQQLQYVPHSGNGTIKATTLTLVQDVSTQKLANTPLPVLAVAIKGSKTVVDWMVNLNSKVCDADKLLVSQVWLYSGTVSSPKRRMLTL
jgi:hypothetical protein